MHEGQMKRHLWKVWSDKIVSKQEVLMGHELSLRRKIAVHHDKKNGGTFKSIFLHIQHDFISWIIHHSIWRKQASFHCIFVSHFSDAPFMGVCIRKTWRSALFSREFPWKNEFIPTIYSPTVATRATRAKKATTRDVMVKSTEWNVWWVVSDARRTTPEPSKNRQTDRKWNCSTCSRE
jgi:hypothetical protein